MGKSRLWRTLPLLFLLPAICSCTQTTVPQPTAQELTGSLSIIYIAPSGTTDIYGPAIEDFKKRYPGVEVKTEVYYDAQKLDDRINAMDFPTEGPDLLLVNSDTTLDVQRMAADDLFLDLQPYLGQDSTYRAENFFDLLPAGMVDGKQALLPLAFTPSYGMTSQEMLARRSIVLPPSISLSQTTQAFLWSAESIGENSEDATFLFNVRKKTSLTTVLEFSRLSFINWNNRKVFVDREGLQEIANLSTTIDADIDKIRTNMQKNSQRSLDMVDTASRTSVIIGRDNIAYPALYYESIYQTFLQEHCQLIKFPTYGDSGASCALVSHYGMVNAQTINPKVAYALLRLIMDKPIDETYVNAFYAPVCLNRENVEKNLHWVTANGLPQKQILHGRELEIPPISQGLADQIQAILDSVQYGVIPNAGVDAIVNECMAPYIQGNRPFEDCAAQLEQRLNTYISEYPAKE